MNNFLLSTASQQEIQGLDTKIHETVDTINQLKTNREFFLSFAKDPQQFIHKWIVSQTRDLKVHRIIFFWIHLNIIFQVIKWKSLVKILLQMIILWRKPVCWGRNKKKNCDFRLFIISIKIEFVLFEYMALIKEKFKIFFFVHFRQLTNLI